MQVFLSVIVDFVKHYIYILIKSILDDKLVYKKYIYTGVYKLRDSNILLEKEM